jgi:predicted enzyme related to lactoylglutathione lyase
VDANTPYARLCIDANDVDVVSAFYAALFGYTVRETDASNPSDTWRHLEPPTPSLPKLTIQPVPEHKNVKNRLHLDVFVTDPEPWIERAVALGGTELGRSEDPEDWFQVIADPEANEFCICRIGT